MRVNKLFSMPAPSGENFTLFDQPILSYVDAGQSPLVNISCLSPGFNSGVNQFLVLMGYELDCNAAPCAAIANH
jgi:hypothetical protein